MADAYNSALPLDSDYARFAADELRSIKARMDAMSSLSSAVSALFPFVNRAQNPEFIFDQINEGGAYIATGYDQDGWRTSLGVGPGVMSRVRSLDTDGRFSRLSTVTVIDAAIAAADVYLSAQALEGYFVKDFRQGKAEATGFTVSFKATASIAGNYSIAFQNAANNRSYVTTFNIAVANTEQQIILNIPGDIAGVWNLTSTSAGLGVFFDHGCGANFIAPLLNQWQAGNFIVAAGAIQQISTLNSTFRWKDFQVQKGTVISPVFEQIPYDVQLRHLQRYLEKSFNQGTAAVQNSGTFAGAWGSVQVAGVGASHFLQIPFKVTKRITPPALVTYNPAAANAQIRNQSAAADFTVTALNQIGENGVLISGTTPAGSAAGNITSVHWLVDARLP